MLSIVISFILFPKALNWKYIAGFAAVLVSTAYTFYLKAEKKGEGGGGRLRKRFQPKRASSQPEQSC